MLAKLVFIWILLLPQDKRLFFLPQIALSVSYLTGNFIKLSFICHSDEGGISC